MKITKKITETKEVEVEIELPYFSKSNTNDFFKITKEKEVFKVWLTERHSQITHSKYQWILDEAISGIPCTEAEFSEAFNKAAEKIFSKTEKVKEDGNDNK